MKRCVPSATLARVAEKAGGSQLRVFEQALAVLTDRAAEAPLLLVLEDLHWADASTLDLALFLAHNLLEQRVLLLATFRADERSSSRRMRRFADDEHLVIQPVLADGRSKPSPCR